MHTNVSTLSIPPLVYIIEDESQIQLACLRSLTKWIPISFASGREMVAHLQESSDQPDLIILDGTATETTPTGTQAVLNWVDTSLPDRPTPVVMLSDCLGEDTLRPGGFRSRLLQIMNRPATRTEFDEFIGDLHSLLVRHVVVR